MRYLQQLDHKQKLSPLSFPLYFLLDSLVVINGQGEKLTVIRLDSFKILKQSEISSSVQKFH